jgi:hypothetical protein
MTTSRTGRIGAAALAVGLALGISPLAAVADDILPPDGVAPVVGMAYDGSGLWLAGASANDGIVVKADTGDEVRFDGEPQSVQALAWSDGRLWVADFGDENASRDYVVAFRLNSIESDKTRYNAFDFRYQDGARDAKAFLTDGYTMALRTEKGIEYIDAYTWETVVTDTIEGAPEGESIARSATDEVFVGGNPGIRTTAKPASDTTTTVTPTPTPTPTPTEPAPSEEPSGGASPSGTPTATSEATDPAVEDVPDGPGPSRRGTIIALALAGVLALGAGAVTYFVRK